MSGSCELCGKPVTKEGHRFCSIRCRQVNNASQQKKTGEYRNCIICGKRFYVHPSDIKRIPALCCSSECAGKSRRGKNHWNYSGKINRICQNCGRDFRVNPFKVKNGGAKYCSRECAREGRLAARIATECSFCGEPLELTYSRFHSSIEHYCSRECYGKDKCKPIGERESHVQKTCAFCGKEFYAYKYDVDKGMGRFCSQTCFGGYRSGTAEISYSHAHGGKREDLGGLYVRSSWEANWARYLNWLQEQGEIKTWEYEPDTFEFPIKRGGKFYTPDFKLTYHNDEIEYHEVKGYMDPKSKTKLKRMAKYYPEIKIIVIDRDQYEAVAREVKNLVPNWE